jgi:outer membrane protein TolC
MTRYRWPPWSRWSPVLLLAAVAMAAAAPPAQPAAQAQALTLEAALRSALQGGIAARGEVLDRVEQQARWESAQAEFEPKPSLSSQARRHWIRGLPGTTDEAGVSAGATWKFLSGAQLEARWIRDFNRSPQEGTVRPLTRVLEVVQPLLRGAGPAARLGLERARLDEHIGRHLRSLALDNVMVSVSLAYLDAVASHQQVELARRALERFTEARTVNQSLLQAGRLAQVELLQSDADIAQAELELAQARNDAQAAASALLQLLGPELAGRRPEDLVLPDDLPSARDPEPVPDSTQAVAEAQSRRADLLLARTAVDAARVGVAQAADEARAALDLGMRLQSGGGAATVTADGAVQASGTDRSISLAWELPLDRGVLRLRRSQSQVDLQRAELALEDAHRVVRTEVDNALRDLGFARRQLTLAAAAVELNRRKLEAETERFRAGKTSGFQLSAAQDELHTAESAHAQAAMAVQRAMVQLDWSLGRLEGRRQALMQAMPR